MRPSKRNIIRGREASLDRTKNLGRLLGAPCPLFDFFV